MNDKATGGSRVTGAEIQQAGKDIRQFASRFRAVFIIAELLEEIGSLDDAVKEAHNRKAAAEAAADLAKSKMGAEEEKLAEAQKKVRDAEARATQIVADAETRKTEILGEAATEKAAILEKAGVDAGNIKKDAEDRNKALTAANAELTQANKNLTNEVAERRKEHGVITSQIEDMRKKIGGLIA